MSQHHTNYRGKFISEKTDFQEQCDAIIDLNKNPDEVLRASRNTIHVIHYEGQPCVVKSFKIPSFPQNYSYGLFVKSKAQKSYDNASRLLELGFNTPAPVGYFEACKAGKLTTSYYLSDFHDAGIRLDQLIKENTLTAAIIEDLAAYSYRLHKNGVFHRDFNPTNLLLTSGEQGTEFSIVDINRITWSQPLSKKASMSALSRLGLRGESRDRFLAHYAKISGIPEAECHEFLELAEQKTQLYFKNKKRLRLLFPKK